MTRSLAELFPLQADGRAHLPEASSSWHSQVLISGLRDEVVSIRLRSRKASPDGASIDRHCSCSKGDRLLCGPCALRGQLLDSRALGKDLDEKIFSITPHVALTLIRAVCEQLGLPPFRWHDARRGMAQDLIAKGASISYVLFAGGWRSAAFLRYINRRDLDARALVEVSMQNSDSDEC